MSEIDALLARLDELGSVATRPESHAQAYNEAAAMIRVLRRAGIRVLGAWDALDAVPIGDPRPTSSFLLAFDKHLNEMRKVTQ